MKIIDQISTANSVVIITDNPLSEISTTSFFVNNTLISSVNPGNTTTIWYQTASDTVVPGRALVRVNNLNSGVCYIFSATLYSNPTIEFWKNDFNFSPLDTALVGGTWSNGILSDALGVAPSDIIIDGDRFMSPSVSFAPEELVPGHTQDSLGITIYTQGTDTNAVIISGTFPIVAGTTTTARISVLPDAYGYISVYYEGKIFNRSTSTVITDNQFFIDGNNIVLPPQTTSGVGGFTFVRIGGIGLIDSNSALFEDLNSGIVESLAAYDDVHSAFVLVNGQEVQQITTTTDYGFSIEPSWTDWNRAAVRIHNMPDFVGSTVDNRKFQVDAWFFNTPYVRYSKLNEQIITVPSSASSQTFILTYLPGQPLAAQPYSDKAIVEISTSSSSTDRKRLSPPYTSYYVKESNNLTYSIHNAIAYPPNYFLTSEVFVYADGVRLQAGIEFYFDLPNNNIILQNTLFPDGTRVAVVSSKFTGIEYDYIINDNILYFPTPLSDKNIRILTWNDHIDKSFRTETRPWNSIRRVTLLNPVIDDNLIWVYLDGRPLVHRFDFEIMPDGRTIQFSDEVEATDSSEIIATIVSQPDMASRVYAYRIFNDFFGRTHYKRISVDHTTFLTGFVTYTSEKLPVFEPGALSPSNYAQNIPGVALIDRERIEFFRTDNNELQILRRGTLGTGPAFYLDEGTKVVDQGVLQTIPYEDTLKVQKFLTTSTNTYAISTITSSTNWGDGITIDSYVQAIDQLEVYYSGRKLRKSSYNGYTSVTSTTLVSFPPEFSINTASQLLILNIDGGIISGVQVQVLQKIGLIFTGTQSILTSNDRVSRFIRQKEAELPDLYYYGGDPRLLDTNNEPITTDDGITIRRY